MVVTGEVEQPTEAPPTRWHIKEWFVDHDVATGALGWFVFAIVFFRHSTATGFERTFGNSGDARLQLVIQEHWLQVIHGRVSWRNPEFFHPSKNVLGYSDTLLLNELVYLPLRALGLDEFLAFQWTIIVNSFIGFLALYLVLRVAVKLDVPRALLLTGIGTFPNGLYLKWGHLQLYALHWLPVVGLLLYAGMRAEANSRRRASFTLAGFTFGLMTYSTYYIGWFSVLSAATFLIVYAVIRLCRVGLHQVLTDALRLLPATAWFGLGSIVPLALFAWTYLPVLGSSGGRRYEDVMLFAPRPADMLNVSGTNLVWGRLMQATLSDARLANGEVHLALTPTLMLLAALCLAIGLVVLRRPINHHLGDISLGLALAAAMLLVLPVRFEFGSLWRLPWVVVPGAVGIRAAGRLAIVVVLVAVLAIGLMLRIVDDALRHRVQIRRWIRWATTAMLILAAVEQVNTELSSRLDRSDELGAIFTIPAPPSECRAFFVIDSVPDAATFYEASIDAMLVAQETGLPTLNGYSGQFPENYTMIDPYSPNYLESVRAWASANGMERGLCSYDRSAKVWARSASEYG